MENHSKRAIQLKYWIRIDDGETRKSKGVILFHRHIASII